MIERQQKLGHVSYLGVLQRHRPDPFLPTHVVNGWSSWISRSAERALPAFFGMRWTTTRVVLDHGGRFYFAKDVFIGPKTVEVMFEPEKLRAF